ncbi:MAG: AraC family transcriptional regulator [Blautia sp.]|nr:AraC family transcriptional regulator [Blautia sp.]MDY5030572.1 AraC family transcriptional regulator [Blautia sp.]
MYPDLALKEKVTHGTPRNPIHALHLSAGEGTPFPDHFFVKRHWHNYIEIIFIQKGSYLFEINLENHYLSQGDICILNSEELHQITGLEPDTSHAVVLFDPRIIDFSYKDEWEQMYISPFLEQTLLLQNVIRSNDPGYPNTSVLVRKLLEESLEQRSGWYIRSKLLLLELFSHMCEQQMLLHTTEVLSPADTKKIERYKSVISYIEAHYSTPVSLEQMADTIPCNSQYLCRFFKEISGISPIQYLINYRIDQACAQLLTSSKSITEIALDCGFENISYFIRKFKEIKGSTPKEYRNMYN